MHDHAALLDRFLSAPAATLPSYAADGRLYFLNDAAGSAQVWEMPPGGGPRPRTAHRDAVGFVAGSPRDGGAVFGRDAAGDERVQLYHLPPEGEPCALTAAPKVMHGWGGFAPGGQRVGVTANARDPAHADPCVIALADGAMRRLCEVQGPHEWAAWHPDGESMLLASAPHHYEATLSQVVLGTGERTDATPGGAGWRHLVPRWRKDGAGFWLATDRGRDFLGLAWMAPGGEPRFLHAPDADVERLEPSPDQRLLAITVNLGGWSQLRLLDAESGAVVAEPAHPPRRDPEAHLAAGRQGDRLRPAAADAARHDLERPTDGSPATLLFAAGEAPEGARIGRKTASSPMTARRSRPS